MLTPYVGTSGNVGCHNREGIYHLGSNVGKIEVFNSPYDIFVLEEYLHLFLTSNTGYLELSKHKKATAQESISINAIRDVNIPIPPLSTQLAIVDIYARLEPLMRKYQKLQISFNQINVGINELLKKSILQEAIQGRLVPQIASEGTSDELLEEIRSEKQHLVKEGKLKKSALANESRIFRGDDNKYREKIGNNIYELDTEMPFEIPESWCWVRLGEIFDHNTGKALNGKGNGSILKRYLTTSNVYWNSFDFIKVKEMLFTESEIAKCTVTKGDLLVCEGGDIGRAAIWDFDYNMCIQNHIHRLRSYVPVTTSFFLRVLQYYKALGLIGGKGIGIQGLSSKALHNIIIPLPPRSEQSRIIEFFDNAVASIMSR